jgi:hypothetical protein
MAPALPWMAAGLLGGGVLLELGCVPLIALPVRRASDPVPAGSSPWALMHTGPAS